MKEAAFHLFETPLGWCAVVWTASGLAAVRWPEADRQVARTRLLRRHAEATEQAPPPEIAEVVARIIDLLSGEAVDFTDVRLDLGDAPEFHRKVYAAALTIPRGQTLTYGEVAALLGERRSAQAVGQALGRNPTPIVVPCHRVLAADGRTGGFSAPGGVDSKLKLLMIEGWRSAQGPTLFDDDPAFAALRRR